MNKFLQFWKFQTTKSEITKKNKNKITISVETLVKHGQTSINVLTIVIQNTFKDIILYITYLHRKPGYYYIRNILFISTQLSVLREIVSSKIIRFI